jgi:hypothetical protein
MVHRTRANITEKTTRTQEISKSLYLYNIEIKVRFLSPEFIRLQIHKYIYN